MNVTLSDLLHEAGQLILLPCMIVLCLFIAASIWQVGTVFMEYIMQHRKIKENISLLLEKLYGKNDKEIEGLIEEANILSSHKKSISMVVNSKAITKEGKEILARTVLQKEESILEKNVRITDYIAKLGPMFGLLGTLIPLGPGIVALGYGDTELLSQSMAIAFDTTIAGVICAAVCYVISKIRKTWYEGYMNDLEAILETILIEGVGNAKE